MEVLLVFLPLIAAVFVGLTTRTISVSAAQFITSGSMVISAILSGIVFYQVVLGGEVVDITLLRWIDVGSLRADWALKIDSLTAIMLVVVTWVSALVHIYSIGYMSHDPHPQRFMAYLSLFTFFMLMLVTADNFVQLFLGWEGVGLCSYLLIGFWYKKDSANAASMKAFIVNRVGDFGFALGIFAIYMVFGSVEFDVVFPQAAGYATNVCASISDHPNCMEFLGISYHAITVICLLLFIGAMGKSAQLLLHTWLPDAMEGPTPVSALIHAATMVTAGVFMVARCSPLFEHSPLALDVVTYVGAITCIFAASVALTQHDIKRVIAYSTCSQLGYMFFACGVSAYSAGVFHLMTHGFFKALLFLGAGSVIHAMSNEQDMRKMGGVWKLIPFTYVMMIIGTLAITGVPFLSGYFSKDMILEAAWAAGNEGSRSAEFAFILGIIAATLTAFYSWRLIFLTFHGKPRASKKVMSHVHESPKVMTIPLLLLSIGALGAGAFASVGLHIVDADTTTFWGDSITMKESSTENVLADAHNVPKAVKWAPLVVGVIGLALAWLCYIKFTSLPDKACRAAPWLHQFLYRKWYFDEIYDLLLIKPTKLLGIFFWKCVDVNVIDRFGPNGFAWSSQRLGGLVRRVQSGYVYHYAFAMLIGVVLLISWYVYNITI